MTEDIDLKQCSSQSVNLFCWYISSKVGCTILGSPVTILRAPLFWDAYFIREPGTKKRKKGTTGLPRSSTINMAQTVITTKQSMKDQMRVRRHVAIIITSLCNSLKGRIRFKRRISRKILTNRNALSTEMRKPNKFTEARIFSPQPHRTITTSRIIIQSLKSGRPYKPNKPSASHV